MFLLELFQNTTSENFEYFDYEDDNADYITVIF